ncbi:3-hydroxyacyl-CoA dehydrogenase family protein [Candidatus Seongchinamella marina]
MDSLFIGIGKDIMNNDRMTVAILGCGVIGLSWVKAFLSNDYKVNVWDPSPDVYERIESSDLKFNDDQLEVSSSPQAAVSGASFIQESGPERLEAKKELISSIEAHVEPECIFASSTSTIMPSDLQEGSILADRIVIGHPFNPPNLLPLVEVVGGDETSEHTLELTLQFYRSLGKQAIQLHTERKGHLANRMQAAQGRYQYLQSLRRSSENYRQHRRSTGHQQNP